MKPIGHAATIRASASMSLCQIQPRVTLSHSQIMVCHRGETWEEEEADREIQSWGRREDEQGRRGDLQQRSHRTYMPLRLHQQSGQTREVYRNQLGRMIVSFFSALDVKIFTTGGSGLMGFAVSFLAGVHLKGHTGMCSFALHQTAAGQALDVKFFTTWGSGLMGFAVSFLAGVHLKGHTGMCSFALHQIAAGQDRAHACTLYHVYMYRLI